MTMSKYIVTGIDVIQDGERRRGLAIVPSESLPEQRESQLREGKLTRIMELLKKLED